MSDRLLTPPTNSIPLGTAVLCGNGEHIYDGAAWNGTCPSCGSEHGINLLLALGEKERASAGTLAGKE